MIISHKHKFIFLKTVKTAGTSIQAALAEHCGEEDIITGKDIGKNANKIPKIKDAPSVLHHEHVYLHFVKHWLGPEIWNSYFKFAFIRNPFDLAISKYYWDFKKRPDKFELWWEHYGGPNYETIKNMSPSELDDFHIENFQNYIKDGKLYGSFGVTNKILLGKLSKNNLTNYHQLEVKNSEDDVYINYEHTFYPWLCDPFYYDEMGMETINPNINPYIGGIDVDFVGRYEQLDKDINYIGEKLGLKLKLPKINANTRDKNKKIHEYYNEETMFYIEDYFKWDLQEFFKKDK